MDLPPSGWYPDPYGVPGLLRWWDGSTWTEHTHASGGRDAADGAGAAPQHTAVQPTTVQPAVQPTAVQPAVRPAAVQPTAVQPTAVQAAVQPTMYQPAVQSTDANGTQVLFLGDDAWTTPGLPGGAKAGGRFGFDGTDRTRRLWLMGGLAGGTALALALIGLVVSNLAGSHSTPPAAKNSTRPVAATTQAAPPSPTPTPTASVALVTDTTSGLSYTQLPAPWQPTCPASLNSVGVTWTRGESAIAAQINGGQTTWYGEACSAQLPQQYGYNGVADLNNVATNLTNNITGSFYNSLPHNGVQQVLSQPVTVSGHAGWEVKFLVTYTNTQGMPFTTEDGAVVVADLGSGLPPAVFFASIPSIPANLGGANVDSLVSSLQLTVPPQPGAGGSPGDGSPGDSGPPGNGGSPGDGGQGQGGQGQGGQGPGGGANGSPVANGTPAADGSPTAGP